ncbi:Fc.00g048610.m01.CDS01 [Cosmosporella sp. VM-42]
MIPARPVIRSSLPRATRSIRAPRQQIRFQSSTSSTASSAQQAASNNSHIAVGVASGFAGAALFYGAYTFTPAGRTASNLNKAAKEAEKKYSAAVKKLQEQTPSADQAIDSIKQFAYSYVGWIPGGRAYVDAVFKDWETVRENHREEADKLVNDAYKQFQDVSKSGFSLETVSKAYDVFADLAKKVADLAGDAFTDVIDNHPQLKEQLGGSVDQLKQMGDEYGPEAKKQVDETWKQVKDIVAGGLSASSLEKARKLIQEKVEQVKKLGDEAWKKGLEEVKPILDKNPKVKELVENNADALKQGNAKELFDRARSAVESGDLGDLQKYVDNASEKVKSKGSELSGGWVDVEKYMKMIPNGDEILPKLKALGEVAEKHKDEGEKLLKETVEELKKVLDKKSEKAKEIADSAKEEGKKEAK